MGEMWCGIAGKGVIEAMKLRRGVEAPIPKCADLPLHVGKHPPPETQTRYSGARLRPPETQKRQIRRPRNRHQMRGPRLPCSSFILHALSAPQSRRLSISHLLHYPLLHALTAVHPLKALKTYPESGLSATLSPLESVKCYPRVGSTSLGAPGIKT